MAAGAGVVTTVTGAAGPVVTMLPGGGLDHHGRCLHRGPGECGLDGFGGRRPCRWCGGGGPPRRSVGCGWPCGCGAAAWGALGGLAGWLPPGSPAARPGLRRQGDAAKGQPDIVRLVLEGGAQHGGRGDVLGQVLQRPRRPLRQQPYRRSARALVRRRPFCRRPGRPLRRRHQFRRVAAGVEHDREDILRRAGEGLEQGFECPGRQCGRRGLRAGQGGEKPAPSWRRVPAAAGRLPRPTAQPTAGARRGIATTPAHDGRAWASVRLIAGRPAPGSAGVPSPRDNPRLPGGSHIRTGPACRPARSCPRASPRSPPRYRRG